MSSLVALGRVSRVEHEAYQFEACSDTEEEFLIGYDEEELWHIDFDQKNGVVTSPDFTGPMTFPGLYDLGVSNMAKCKINLQYAKGLKIPPPQLDAPQTSIFPKDNVQLGILNTLVCHVTGFYPPSVRVLWMKNNVNVTGGMSLSQYRPRTDGTFNIFSTLKFTPAEGDIYSCTVNHRALQGQPQTKTWDVEVALPGVGPAVFCGIGLTLGLLGVAAGTLFLIKGNSCN
ncbi:HLA class II histocompatibility antigen, DP alpha 1 chain-like isoform X2 [Megalobrama amblycephala]|uniref:HLA class II histocompatibility antigen, DP alpha 1 chain-like isoform X2 n=1 Tax=Megalobrama amblycephala TaxID=75352 RepID=UPI0020141A9C|nr:HLA class II histocompatibility antigen, DP alpha 1 chain-like isoform X2 [Megalobrama amblycephala]